jgi:predicted transcriptional regulator
MTLRDLSRLDLGRQQYRAILYLAEGEATFEELCQALEVSKTQGYEAVSPLVRWGLVEKVNGRYRLSPALEDLFAPLRQKAAGEELPPELLP